MPGPPLVLTVPADGQGQSLGTVLTAKLHVFSQIYFAITELGYIYLSWPDTIIQNNPERPVRYYSFGRSKYNIYEKYHAQGSCIVMFCHCLVKVNCTHIIQDNFTAITANHIALLQR